MPTYSIDGPDGKTYSIDGPAGATREQVIAKIKEKQQPKPQEQPSTLGDVATSFGRGIAKGAIGLAGLPGDVSNLVGAGVHKLGSAIGLPEPPPEALNKDAPGVPSSGTITHAVEDVTGKFEKPKTTAGKYAESVGTFVPSAVLGPGGWATRAATTLAGGVASEAAGELTEGTAAEPYARVAGGLAAGAGTGLAAAEAQSARLAARLPSIDDIKKSAQAAYKAVENARLIASEGSLNGLVSATRAGLDQQLITDTVAPRTFQGLSQLAKSGGDIAQIMGVRQSLGKINPSAGTDYEAAQHVRDAIDNYVETLPPTEIVQGDPQFTQAMLDHARSSWRAYAKLDQVQSAMEIGSHTAAVAGTGANTQNAMRQRIRQILDSEKNSRGFSADTREQMENIVMGTWLQNAARQAGKFAPSGPVSTMATIAAGFGGGPAAAAGIAIPATIAKYLGTYLTKRAIRQLEDTIRAESPIGKPVAAANAAQAPNYEAIAPAAALRSVLAAGSGSPLADQGP
jgi:hypothetical protein